MGILRLRPANQDGNLCRVGPDAVTPYNLTQKRQAVHSKFAFAELTDQLCITQGLQYQTQMLHMLFRCPAEDENVIQVHQTADAYMLGKHTIHESLECGWCISQTKTQHLVLKLALVSDEGSFMHVFFLEPDLIIGLLQVKRTEILSTMQAVQQLINSWQWILIFDGLVIETSVVHTHAQATIWFCNKQDRCTIRTIAQLYPILFKQISQSLLNFKFLTRG